MTRIHAAFWGILGAAIFILGCASVDQTSGAASGAHPKFAQLCSKCHTLDRVHAAHSVMSQDEMRDLVSRMATKPESGIDPNSIEDIVMEIY